MIRKQTSSYKDYKISFLLSNHRLNKIKKLLSTHLGLMLPMKGTTAFLKRGEMMYNRNMEMRKYETMTSIGELVAKKTFRPPLRFTTIHHPVKKKLGISFSTYAVMDSIYHLSHRPNHPWCTYTKKDLATFLDITDRTVYSAINEGLRLGLLEKNDRGDLRTTEKWFKEVIVYEEQKGDI